MSMEILKFFSKDQQVVNDYFRQRRQQRFERHGAKMRHIGFHNLMHRILLPVLILMGKMEGRKVTVLQDRRTGKKTKRPTIFACTHVGGCDIETALEAIVSPCYLFLGDPGEVYRSLDGLFLSLNGVIALETRDKIDRHIAYQRGVALLKGGGNLLIFPEGAWNITANEPVMKLFPGAASLALECKADIVPLAVERREQQYDVIIGNTIPYGEIKGEAPKALTARLRDILATLKWEIWEHHGVCRREQLSYEEALPKFYATFPTVAGCGIENNFGTRYLDKYITTPEEAFRHLQDIQPSPQTAFLFHKRLE